MIFRTMGIYCWNGMTEIVINMSWISGKHLKTRFLEKLGTFLSHSSRNCQSLCEFSSFTNNCIKGGRGTLSVALGIDLYYRWMARGTTGFIHGSIWVFRRYLDYKWKWEVVLKLGLFVVPYEFPELKNLLGNMILRNTKRTLPVILNIWIIKFD